MDLKKILTEVIIPKGLNDLRYKKECQFHWVLCQDSMCVLENQGVAIESSLKKGVGDNWGYRSPKEKILGACQRMNRISTIGYLELLADQWI